MKLFERVGHLKVVRQDRNKQGVASGLRTGWTEYQVRAGNRVLSRHEHLHHAMDAARVELNAHWDRVAAELKAIAAR